MGLFTRSLQMKIALAYVSILLVMLALLNTYPITISQDFVFQTKQQGLLDAANLMSTLLSETQELNADAVAGVMSRQLAVGRPFRILVCDSDLMVLFDNSQQDNYRGKYAIIPEVSLALSGKDVFYSKFVSLSFESSAAVPVISQNKTIGAVFLHESDTVQAVLLAGIQSNMMNVSMLISMIVVLLTILISYMFSRRTTGLLKAIKSVHEGQYSHRAKVSGRDEIAELAAEFNSLSDRLQLTEEMRRRFVSDASHELKTPLASIRLLTDSILQTRDMDKETLFDFVTDIGDEIDRLTRMSEKLITLTRLDTIKVSISEDVNLKLIVERVGHMLTPLANHYNVKIELDLDGFVMISGSEDDLYQVVFNLMENGIKYNHPGGKLLARLFSDDKYAVLIVEDTGMGIPEDDLPLIFGRFYRVDRARSREAGGSGLGLSIVRSNVELHGGTIEVESKPDVGTKFVLRFPLLRHYDRKGEVRDAEE